MLLAADRVLALVLISGFLVVAAIVARQSDASAERAGWWALVIGLVAARIGYVVGNWEAFAVEPASILAIWQGGFSLLTGVAAGVLAILSSLRLRFSSLIMVGAMLVLSSAYVGASHVLQPAPRPLPARLAVQTLAGKSVNLSAWRGQPVVINLWASWCLPCRREMPMLVDTASRSRVPILLINSGEDRVTAERFLRANRLPMHSVFLDDTASLATAIGAGGYPATIFIDEAGQVQSVHVGELSRAMLAAEMQGLEPGLRKAHPYVNNRPSWPPSP